MFQPAENGHAQSRILRQYGSQSHAPDFHFQNKYKKQTQRNVGDIHEYGNPHRNFGMLHPDEPAFEGIQTQDGGRCPDADVEILCGHGLHLGTSVHTDKSQQTDGILQQQQQKRGRQSDTQGTGQYMHAFLLFSSSVRLSGKTAGSHTEKSEIPVYHIEDHRTQGNGSDIHFGTHVPYNSQIDHPQQGDGQCGDDVRNGESEDFPVHTESGNVLASAGLSMSSSNSSTKMNYVLNVDTSDYPIDSFSSVSDDKKADLAATIAHEMTHLVMYDTVTSSMLDGRTTSFPDWFVEGMAQTSSGDNH